MADFVIDLTSLTADQGFVIQGDAEQDYAGYSVAGAGDVNGDGIADLIVGAPEGDDGGNNAGEAYVIYGQTGVTRGRVDLTNLTAAQGFVIQGDVAGDRAGGSVAGVGDVNGDGIADLIVGASQGNDGGDVAGEAYVIYGQAGTARGRVDLTNLARADGFIIQGDASGNFAGSSVAGAGDVNGDGINDLIVGAPYGGNGAGEAYVVFGQIGATRGRVDLTTLTAAQGFAIQGDFAGGNAGHSVAGAGDVNGDGIADLIVGAPEGNDGGADAGEAYVLYGQRGSTRGRVDLTILTSAQGFVIQGDVAGDEAGFSVGGAGDVNGDGVADLIVGAPSGNDGGQLAGEAYVIYGQTGATRSRVDLTSLTAAQGFVIQGDLAFDQAGRSVSGAGDVNADGIADLIVGAPLDGGSGEFLGQAYVIFGKAGTTRSRVDLTSLDGTEGFAIQGDALFDRAGYSVASAGDVNGDGVADLIVGADRGDDGGRDAGEAYVIYGQLGTAGGRVDLSGLTAALGFVIQGDGTRDAAGYSVAFAGDVNGDGIGDLIVGAPGGDDGGENAGQAYVIYGQAGANRGIVELRSLIAAQGFVIQGDERDAAEDQAGYSVAGAGDVNGDGIDDLIVGVPFGDNGGSDAGQAYVIYGQAGASRGLVELRSLVAAQGFVIQGDVAFDQAGISVDGAGDVNGDGVADLIVGASGGDDGGFNAGEAYVIYGQAGATQGRVDLTTLTTAQGFVIRGDEVGDEVGRSVAGAGDVNGDGIADLIVGAPGGSDGGIFAGEAYVIYGQAGATRSRVDLTALTAAQGFAIQGDVAFDAAGSSVAGAGDVNGDGIADLIVGAPSGGDGGQLAGEAYVIYGQGGLTRGRVNLTTLSAAQGFVIQGDALIDQAGTSVARAGDVNGDGIADLIVGAPGGDGGGIIAGEAYVIYGQIGATRGRVDLTALTVAQGFAIQGDAAEDRAGTSVAGGGDVNGDGLADLIVGAPEGAREAGKAYVIYGFAAPRRLVGTAGAETLSGAGGDDTLDGAGGNDLLLGRVGRDTLFGGVGNDTLDGGAGGDRIDGGSGIDFVSYASATGAVIADFAANLFREQGQAHDSVSLVEGVIGSDLADRLTGGASAVTLFGGGGDDRIIGGAGDDSLNGGVGADVIVDRVGSARISGGSGDDQITGSASGDLLNGDAGNDRVSAGGGNDTVTGDIGNDTLNGGIGNDTMVGGAGNDTYVVDATFDRVFETTTTISTADAGGTDTVQSSITISLDAYAGIRFVENLVLTGTTNINGTGNALANRLTGNSGNNALTGGAGNDVLLGGVGNDVLTGGLGNDMMLGGAGNDTFVVDAIFDRVFETTTTTNTTDAGGIDTVQSSVSFSIDALDGIRFVENLVLTGTTNITGTGNALANRMTGNAGNNALNGGLGNDVLLGGVGDDVLTGGLGNDTMVGGAGRDSFIFNATLGAGNLDRISDFNVTDDTIRLDDAIFVGLASGTLAATAFAANTTGLAADASDRLIYETDLGRLFFDIDGVGGVTRVQIATLTAGLAITNADFLVF